MLPEWQIRQPSLTALAALPAKVRLLSGKVTPIECSVTPTAETAVGVAAGFADADYADAADALANSRKTATIGLSDLSMGVLALVFMALGRSSPGRQGGG